MLREARQRTAIGLSAKYLDHPKLSKAITEAASPEGSLRDIRRVNRLIATANTLSTSGDIDPDLTNLSLLTDKLPQIFGWKNRKERKEWNALFKETADTMNSEIRGGHYTNPDEVDRESVFLFYLLDGYSRFAAFARSQDRNLEEERKYGDVVVNALCEVTVALAEQGESGAVEMLKWMDQQKWIEKKWGFSDELVERAHKLSSDTT